MSTPRGAESMMLEKRGAATAVVLTAAVVLVWVGSRQPVGAVPALLDGALLLGPLGCAVAAVLAGRALPSDLRRPWLLVTLAACTAACARVLDLAGVAGADGAWAGLLDVTAIALVSVATAWILHQRDHERVFETVLDAVMVLSVATVVTLHWSPTARAVLAGTAELSPAQQVVAFAAPIAAGCAFLWGSVLLRVRSGSSSAAFAAGVAGCSVAFGIAVAPGAIDAARCCSPSTAAPAAWFAGWAALAYAGVSVRRQGTLAFLPVEADAGGSRLRLVVAPAVAVVIAAAVIDSAWRDPLSAPTALAIGLLGTLLALRMSQLLFQTHRQSEERLQLAQSRTLVELSRALAGTTLLDETLTLVTEWAVKLLGGRAATIELLSDDGRMLEFHAVHGLPAGAERLRFPVDGSFTGWVVMNGVARKADDPRVDPFIDQSGLEYLGTSPVAAAPLRYRERILGALGCIGTHPFTARDMELLGALADQAAVAIENARLFEQVVQLSMTDPLTNLPNRRQLERDLAREFAAARRGRPLIAVMFDVNGFKEYNDRNGHPAGDEALRRLSETLQVETRAMNTVARYGGDEFIALLADADSAGAEMFIQRVRERFRSQNDIDPSGALDVSAGYAAFEATMRTPADLVAAADRALYLVKGR